MDRYQHRLCNAVLGAPPGATIEQCTALPVRRVQYEDGTPAVVSYWKPTEDELTLLRMGCTVRLIVHGHTHAPVHVGVDGDGVC